MRLAGVSMSALLAASCAGSGSDVVTIPPSTEARSETTSTTADTVAEVFAEPAVTVADTTPPVGAATSEGPLADVCPAVVTMQIVDSPGPAVGALYRMLGPGAEVDETAATSAGPIIRPDGTVEDVRLEIRSGGPMVGFEPPLDLLATDETLLLAQASTADVVLAASEGIDAISVIALTEKTHQAVVWDPATYPAATDIASLGATGAEVRHVSGARVVEFLVERGVLDEEQTTPGSDGGPAAFVESGGDIAQLGDLLIDPPLFESLPQWGRPVAAATARDEGWVGHDDTLAVRRSDLSTLGSCLGRLIPIVQASTAAYASDPTPTDQVMASVRSRANPLNRVTSEMMDAGVASGVAAGVFGNGPNDTVGDFDSDTLDDFAVELGADSAEAAFTNDFLDPTIGF